MRIVVFIASILLTVWVAYITRGYLAVGGEWVIPAIVLFCLTKKSGANATAHEHTNYSRRTKGGQYVEM